MMERQLFALSLGFAGLILLAAAARGDLPAQAPDPGATRLAAVAAPQAKGRRPVRPRHPKEASATPPATPR